MAVLHDLWCARCGGESEDWVEQSQAPACGCGGEREVLFSRLNTDSWGGPRYIASLDRSFDSHSDLKRHLHEEGLALAPSAERSGGARNESHLDFGKRRHLDCSSGLQKSK